MVCSSGEKERVEMDELFDAFVAAYDAAGLDFLIIFSRIIGSLSERVSSDFYYKVYGLWSDKFRPDDYFLGLTEVKFSGEMANDIVSGVESYDAKFNYFMVRWCFMDRLRVRFHIGWCCLVVRTRMILFIV